MVDALIFGLVGGGVIPCDEQLLPLGWGEEGQAVDALFGVRYNALEQRLKVSQQPLNGRGIKEIGGKDAFPLERVIHFP